MVEVPAVHLPLPVGGPVLGVQVLPRLLIGTSSRTDMITLTIRSAAPVTTRPVPRPFQSARAQTAARTTEPMYQTGITAPSIRPPWARASWPLSSGRASKIRFMTKATENSTPTITPTTTVVTT
ncbi:hypothetical protein SHKM778_49670 [Streptomyces sp. KM77-8]|uniref:Uncharacterized protein n=1 Tax=Streptomyces haneummycinicus TaxID=3074435 RepID=A0AAT9HMP4_9ACTN